VLMALSGLQDDAQLAGEPMLRQREIRQRVSVELQILIEIMLCGKRAPRAIPPRTTAPGTSRPAAAPPAPRPRDGELTDADLEEIEYLAGADREEFSEALNEWLTLGDDDGSGERVFFHPDLVKDTYRTIGALIHQTTLKISRARGDADASAQLLEHLRQLGQAREQTREKAGIRRASKEPPAIPQLSDRDRLEIGVLKAMGDREFLGVVSDWMAADDPDGSGARVFLSGPLTERVTGALNELFAQTTVRLQTAHRDRNRTAIADLKARRRRIYVAKTQAALVLKEMHRQERRTPGLTPRRQAYQVLAEVLQSQLQTLHRRGVKNKSAYRQLANAHYSLFRQIRTEIEGGADPRDLAKRLRAETAAR
jgi:hypothetical protein